MTETPLISVIMIFLDERRFIREAIDSVFAQTYPQWELLLIDDGSSDGSSEIARGVAAQHAQRVRYLEHAAHQNLGMSASRNLGIRHANGTFIAFLDADDVWEPAKLQQEIGILNSHPTAAMVFGAAQWWYSWTGRIDDQDRDFVRRVSVQPNSLIQPPELLIALLENETVTTTLALIRRDAFVRAGGFEETFRGLYEDQVFSAKICSKEPVYVADACWYKWRKHPDSSCSHAVAEGRYSLARRAYLSWLLNYLSQGSVRNRELTRTLRRQLWKSRHPFLIQIWEGVKNPRKIQSTAAGIAHDVFPAAVRHWLRARFGGSNSLLQ